MTHLATLAHTLAAVPLKRLVCREAVAAIVQLVGSTGDADARVALPELCVVLAAGAVVGGVAPSPADAAAAAVGGAPSAAATATSLPGGSATTSELFTPNTAVELKRLASLANRCCRWLAPATGLSADGRRVAALSVVLSGGGGGGGALVLPFRDRLRQLAPVLTALGARSVLHARLFAAAEAALCAALRRGGGGGSESAASSSFAGVQLSELAALLAALRQGYSGCYALAVDVCDALTSHPSGRECLARAPATDVSMLCSAVLRLGVVHGPLLEALAQLADAQLPRMLETLSGTIVACAPVRAQATLLARWRPLIRPLNLATRLLRLLVLSGAFARHARLAARLLTFCDAAVLALAEQLAAVQAAAATSPRGVVERHRLQQQQQQQQRGGAGPGTSVATPATGGGSRGGASTADPENAQAVMAAAGFLFGRVALAGQLMTAHDAFTVHNATRTQQRGAHPAAAPASPAPPPPGCDEDDAGRAIYIGMRAPCPVGAPSLPVLSDVTYAALRALLQSHHPPQQQQQQFLPGAPPATASRRPRGAASLPSSSPSGSPLVTAFELGLAAAVRRFAAQERLPPPSHSVPCGDVYTADVGWSAQRLIVEAEGPAHFLPLPSALQLANAAAAAAPAAASGGTGGPAAGDATAATPITAAAAAASACIDSRFGHPVHVNPLLLASHTPHPQQQHHHHRQDLAAFCIASPHAQLPARFRAAHPLAWAASRARGLDDQLRDELLTRGDTPWTVLHVPHYAWAATEGGDWGSDAAAGAGGSASGELALVSALLLPHVDALRGAAGWVPGTRF